MIENEGGELRIEKAISDNSLAMERWRGEVRTLSDEFNIAKQRMDDFQSYHNTHRERIELLSRRLDMVSEDIARQGSDMREHRSTMNQQYSDLLAEIRAGRVENAKLAAAFDASRVKSVVRWQWTMMVVLTIFGISVAGASLLGLDLSELIKLRLGL